MSNCPGRPHRGHTTREDCPLDYTLFDVLTHAIDQARENAEQGKGSGLIVDEASRKVRAMVTEAITPARREQLISDHRYAGYAGSRERCIWGSAIRLGSELKYTECGRPQREHVYPDQDEDPEPQSWRYLPGEWERECDERMLVGAILRQAMNRL